MLNLLLYTLVFAAPTTPSSEPWIGKPFPEISLPGTDGKTHALPGEAKGHWTLVYFYPKDDTPGCTKEACHFRDDSRAFKKLGAQVFGVSGDDLGSHESFKKKYHLNFPLLSDTKHELAQELGVFVDGRNSRDTFLVDPSGKIQAVWRKVDAEKASDEALVELKARLKK